MATPQLKIAAGHDNAAGLLALYEINASLFQRYRIGDPETDWFSQDEILTNGNRSFLGVGLPSSMWLISAMTQAEFQQLRTSYCPGYSANITVRTFNKDWNAYLIYNGTIVLPYTSGSDRAWVRGDWATVRIAFLDLVLYSGFSSGFDPTAFGVS